MARVPRAKIRPDQVELMRHCPVMRLMDAAQIYQIGRCGLNALMKEGRLRYRKVGGLVLLSVEDLEMIRCAPAQIEA